MRCAGGDRGRQVWRGRQRPSGVARETEADTVEGDRGRRVWRHWREMPRKRRRGLTSAQGGPVQDPRALRVVPGSCLRSRPCLQSALLGTVPRGDPCHKEGPAGRACTGSPGRRVSAPSWVPPGPSRSPRVSLRAAARPLRRGGVQVARGAPQISKTTWRTLARRPRAAAAGDEGAAAARLLAAARLRADLRDAAVDGAARGRGDALRGAPLRHLRAPATPAASASGEGTTGCRGRRRAAASRAAPP